MIVADASPLIFLARVELLNTLPKLFQKVLVPSVVLSEATADSARPGARAISEAVRSGHLTLVDDPPSPHFERLAEAVDRGEAAAIALALDRGIRAVLMDDAAGRRLATVEGLMPVGTLGVLVRCSREGLIDDAAGCLRRLESAGLRLDARLRQRVQSALGGRIEG